MRRSVPYILTAALALVLPAVVGDPWGPRLAAQDRVVPAVGYAVLGQAVAAAPVVELPPEVHGLPGEWIPLTPSRLVGGVPKWQLPPGLTEVKLGDLFGEDYAAKAKGKVVKSSVAGRFVVLAWNAKGDVPSDLATCVVVVGDAPPGPSPPGPGPADPLTAKLQAAYAAEPDPAKANRVRFMASVYKGANALIADNQSIADLFGKVSDALHQPALGFPRDGMVVVRAAVGDYLNPNLGQSGTVDRAKATAAFAAVAKSLSEVK